MWVSLDYPFKMVLKHSRNSTVNIIAISENKVASELYEYDIDEFYIVPDYDITSWCRKHPDFTGDQFDALHHLYCCGLIELGVYYDVLEMPYPITHFNPESQSVLWRIDNFYSEHFYYEEDYPSSVNWIQDGF